MTSSQVALRFDIQKVFAIILGKLIIGHLSINLQFFILSATTTCDIHHSL
jgi:hypothetical protein